MFIFGISKYFENISGKVETSVFYQERWNFTPHREKFSANFGVSYKTTPNHNALILNVNVIFEKLHNSVKFTRCRFDITAM